jgi:O-antigen/teichoic acid export membrane protein
VTATSLSILTIMSIVMALGIPLAVRRRISAGDGRDRDVIRTARVYAALTVVPSALLIIPIHIWLLPGVAGLDFAAFCLSMCAIPLTVSWSIDANVLVVRHQFRRVAILAILQGLVSTSVIVALWLTGRIEVSSVLFAFLVGNITTFAFGRWWVRGRGGRIRDAGDLVKEGLHLAGGQIADVSARRLDQVIALPLLGAHATGIYAVGATMASATAPVAQTLGNSAFRELVSGERSLVISTIRRAMALAFATAAAVGLVSWLFIPRVFGEAFSSARQTALAACLGAALSSVSYVAAMALAATRRGQAMTAAQVLGLGIGLVVMVPTAILWGPTGAAIAMATGSLATLLISLRRLGLPLRETLPRPADFPAALRSLMGSSPS